MAKIQLDFVWKNNTPGAVRYQEVNLAGQPRKNDNDEMVIGPVYLRKAALERLGLETPQKFTLIIDDIR